MASRDLAVSIATRVHIASLMAQANESLGLTVSGHIQRVYEHSGAPNFDYALVNAGRSRALCFCGRRIHDRRH